METMNESTSSDEVVNIKEESTDESKIDISVEEDDMKINNEEVDMSIVVNDDDDNKNNDDATDKNYNHVEKQEQNYSEEEVSKLEEMVDNFTDNTRGGIYNDAINDQINDTKHAHQADDTPTHSQEQEEETNERVDPDVANNMETIVREEELMIDIDHNSSHDYVNLTSLHQNNNRDDLQQSAALTLKDLFGALFEFGAKEEAQIRDPSLVDTQKILHDTFGAYITEHDIFVENEEAILAQEMFANKEARHRAEVERLFGVAGTDTLIDEPTEEFTILHSTVPTNVMHTFHNETESTLQTCTLQDQSITAKAITAQNEREIWLVDMPKIIPNRQIMHADPQPFFPSRCAALQSNTRMLYTPYNVMRWAYHKPSKTFMSNSRLVRWSDGSVTVHIGSDTHTLAPNKENANLDLLGTDTVISQNGIELPAITATIAATAHYMVESTTAASVERALIEEGQEHRAMSSLLKPVFATNAMPSIDWNRPRKANGNLFEEYVAHEYEQREKEIARRIREGRPMTLAEQMAMEQEMLRRLQSTSVETLQRQHQQQQLEHEQAQKNKQQHQQQLLRERAGITYGEIDGVAIDRNSSAMSSLASTSLGHRRHHRLDRDLTLGIRDINSNMINSELVDLEQNNGVVNDTTKSDNSLVNGRRHRMEDDNPHAKNESDNSSDDGEEGEMDEYEKIMAEMAAKHERDANDERTRKVARYEETQRERFDSLIRALEKLVSQLPMESDAFGSVEGTLQFLRSGVFAAGIVEKEIPLMLKEVAEELPDISTHDVAASYEQIFQHSSN